MERSSGILMPISSLPSKYGIGTLGTQARRFADFLKQAGQSWWQVLPAGPTGYGDSPYQSFSAWAGNPYFIDLETLADDGLLTLDEIESVNWGDDDTRVDYGRLWENRLSVLRRAYARSGKISSEINLFLRTNSSWLPDYALYMAVKESFDNKSWIDWDDEAIRMHKPDAVKKYSEELHDECGFFVFLQYEFFKQWKEFKEYVNSLGIKILGDLPIYVSMDSSDVWRDPKSFLLDEKNVPIEVAGVPPDYFSENGQLWGNPLYDWDAMRRDGYGWWIRRIDGCSRLYDAIRIDHFRGFESYWAVPYGCETAKIGRWVKGPGISFLKMLTSWFYHLEFVAEDLGILDDDVKKMLADSGLPGMKVLEFAFDANSISDYLPHNIGENSICYLGTHDNAPLYEWVHDEPKENIKFAMEYLGVKSKKALPESLIRAAMSSRAVLCVLQMQDVLHLGKGSRMNTPGTAYGNWQWRMKKDALTDDLASELRRMAQIYSRLPDGE